MLKGLFLFPIIFSFSFGQEDYFCRKKTSKVKIRGANNQDFVFNTNTNGGKRYKGNVDCTVEYIYKKCNKLNIKCPAFNLKNKKNCNKGDYLEVNGEKFCHKNGPSITAEKRLTLRFVSDKRGTASGAECLISCLDDTQTTTKASTSTATTTTTATPTTTTVTEAQTTSATDFSLTFKASLTVVNASSVNENNDENWGPEQALSEISPSWLNYWHSAAGDINPSITFKMQREHEVLAVDVVDRQDCCNERFQSVEVRVGFTPSFDDAQSCGIQSYDGENSYRYVCPNLRGEFVIIKKMDDSEYLHVNHVTVYTKEEDIIETTTLPPATTTTAYTTETAEAILIAGGGLTEVEIWNPDDNTICTIPSLPRGSHHGTLNGMKYCGPYGGNYGNETECVGFSQGVWSRTNAGFQHRRSFHTSWETENGIYLMGGESQTPTSEIARNDGTVTDGFSLQYPIRLSCSIPDGDSVVVTGGQFSQGDVVRYNEDGFVEDLPELITGRFSHACSWYINSQNKMVYLVAGGVSGFSSRLDNAEVLVKGDSAWREVTTRLPVGTVSSFSGVNLNNKVYLIGGYTLTDDWKYKFFDNIIEFQTVSETWETVAKLRNPRGGHGSSVVGVEDFRDHVIDCKSTTTSASTSTVSITSTSLPGQTTTTTKATIITTTSSGSGGLSNAEFCAKDQEHTMCKYPGPSAECAGKTEFRQLSAAAKAAILDKHNELRRRVARGEETSGLSGAQPAAANMKKIVWSEELETVAQRWADQCTIGHDQMREKLDGTYVGQNAYWGASPQQETNDQVQGGMNKAAQSWYDEVSDPGFDSASINPFVFSYGAGHYTQVVWADTEELGCGMVYYKGDTFYETLIVCNYAKAGNFRGSEMYKLGAACSACPSGYTCDDGLCSKAS